MLTKSGLGTLVAAVVLAMLGIWWSYEELVVGSVGITVLVLASIWVARRPLRSSVQRRVETIRVPRGDPVRVSYRVRNDTRHRSTRARLIDRLDDQWTDVVIEPVEPDDVIDLPGTIPTRRRGVFPIGPLDIERIDPFHLAVGRWRNERDDASPVPITVHPKVYELVGPQGAVRVMENESVMRRAATDPLAGFVSMREYVEGDDPRLIHWPTTARTGSLMVREHVEVRRPEFTIVLDAADGLGTDDDFEERVDVAATLAVHALRSGLDVVVRTTSDEHSGRPTPLGEEGQVLELLTPVQPVAESDLVSVASLFVHGFDHTSIVMITGPDGPSSNVSAVGRMITVRIGRGALSAHGVTLAAIDARDFVKRWRAWS